MMRTAARHVLNGIALAAGVFLAASAPAIADGIPMIDAHSQIDIDTELGQVIQWLDKAGIARVILAARRGRPWREIAELAGQHPDRITASVRLKGRNYQRNRPKYYRRLKKQLADPTFGAMAEAILWHAEKGRGVAAEVILLPSEPQVRTALAGALAKGWPFVVHIEFATARGRGDGRRFMAPLEALLRKHRSHPFALIHMGQLEAGEVRRLIEAHPNVYFLTSHANPEAVLSSGQPWTDMFEGDVLAPAWRKLVIDHPRRFVLAFDNVWPRHWSEFYATQAAVWRKALAELPPAVAHAIAHRNAERLWRLPPAR
jgi:predicted TIM-barrel fold metal-dependent hydrolase